MALLRTLSSYSAAQDPGALGTMDVFSRTGHVQDGTCAVQMWSRPLVQHGGVAAGLLLNHSSSVRQPNATSNKAGVVDTPTDTGTDTDTDTDTSMDAAPTNVPTNLSAIIESLPQSTTNVYARFGCMCYDGMAMCSFVVLVLLYLHALGACDVTTRAVYMPGHCAAISTTLLARIAFTTFTTFTIYTAPTP